MIHVRRYATAISIVIALCAQQPTLVAQGQSVFDRDIPSQDDVRASLDVTRRLAGQNHLTANEMLQIYYAEMEIGRCVWGISPRITDPQLIQELKIFGRYVDSSMAAEGARYVQTNQERFRVVDDGWKGEENFWEPNRYWLERVQRSFPNSPEANEIEFDLDFKLFVRRFDIDETAKGKSCEQYVNKQLKESGDIYKEVYSEDELKQWIPRCEQARNEFVIGKKRLLEKLRNAPFTKRLQEIDQTTIVVFYSVC